MPLPDDFPKQAAETAKILARRVERWAGEINPLLMALVVGLLVLNLTLYIGLAAAREPFIWSAPHQVESRAHAMSALDPTPTNPAVFKR